MTRETLDRARKLYDMVCMLDNAIRDLATPNTMGCTIQIHSALKKEYFEFTQTLRKKYQKELDEL